MNEANAGRMPDFIAVGPPRTGTTWLHEVLTGHVGLPAGTKETDFFTNRYAKGRNWYQAHFRHCRADLPIGEIAPTYFDSARARERIAHDIPRCRIICTLRDPVERLYSFYKMMREFGFFRVGFEEAVHKHKQMLDSSRYAFHLSAWQERFGRANVLVLLYDDLKADPQSFVNQVCRFIGIDEFDLANSPVAGAEVNTIPAAPWSHRLARESRHVMYWLAGHRLYRVTNLWRSSRLWNFCFGNGAPFPRLEPEVDARLRPLLLPEVEAVEKLLGRDLAAWKGPSRRAAGPAAIRATLP